MPVDKSVSLNVIADIKRYQAEMAKIPGVTDKQAAASARKMESHFIKAQVKSAQAAEKAAAQSAKAWSAVSKLAAVAIIGTAARATLGFVSDLTQEVADLRNELTDASTRSGLAADTLNGLRLAARGSGQEFGALTSSLDQFPKRLADTARGTGDALHGFKALDVEVANADGSLRSADAVFRETVTALQGIDDKTQRAAIAAQIFGRAGGKLGQAIGDIPLDTLINQAERFGSSVAPGATKAAGDWQRSMASLRGVFDLIKTDLVDLGGAAGLGGFVENVTTGLVFFEQIGSLTFKSVAAQASLFSEQLQAAARGDVDELDRLSGSYLGLLADQSKLFATAKANTEQFVRQARQIRNVDAAVVVATDDDKKHTAAIKASSDATKDARAEYNAYLKLLDISIGAYSDLLTPAEQYRAELQAQIDTIEELGRASNDQEAAAEAVAQVTARAYRDMSAAVTEAAADAIRAWDGVEEQLLSDTRDAINRVASEAEAVLGDAFSLMSDQMGAITDRWREEATKQQGIVQDTAGAIEAIDRELAERRGVVAVKLTNKQLRQQRRLLRGEQEAAGEQAKIARAATMEAFKREQELARVEAGVAAVITGAHMLAFLSSKLGPAAIPIAAGIAAAELGVQLGQINNIEPPTFHQGGIVDGGRQPVRARTDPGPDAVPTMLRPGEEVTTPGERREPQTRVTNYYVGDRLVDTQTERALTRGRRTRERWRRDLIAGEMPGLAKVY